VISMFPLNQWSLSASASGMPGRVNAARTTDLPSFALKVGKRHPVKPALEPLYRL
jgi:hypothetical protein